MNAARTLDPAKSSRLTRAIIRRTRGQAHGPLTRFDADIAKVSAIPPGSRKPYLTDQGRVADGPDTIREAFGILRALKFLKAPKCELKCGFA